MRLSAGVGGSSIICFVYLFVVIVVKSLPAQSRPVTPSL